MGTHAAQFLATNDAVIRSTTLHSTLAGSRGSSGNRSRGPRTTAGHSSRPKSRPRSRPKSSSRSKSRPKSRAKSRPRPGNGSNSSNLASEAARVAFLVRPELDLEPPRLPVGRDDLSISILKCPHNLLLLHPQEISLEKVKGLAPDVHLLVGGHLNPPVALGLVRVVFGVVGSLDGYLLSISKVVLSVFT